MLLKQIKRVSGPDLTPLTTKIRPKKITEPKKPLKCHQWINQHLSSVTGKRRLGQNSDQAPGFDILPLIKTKMFFCFRCFILISQLIFIDFQNLSRMISQMAFWFSKWDISRYYPRDSFSSGWSAILKARTLRPIYHGRTKQRGCVPRKLPQQPSEQSRKCIYSNCRDYSVSPKAH